MIIKKEKELTPYELYFTEAPKKKRKPRRIITANPNDGRLRKLEDDIEYDRDDIDLDADMDGLDMGDGFDDIQGDEPSPDETTIEPTVDGTDNLPDDGGDNGLDTGDDLVDDMDDDVNNEVPTEPETDANPENVEADNETNIPPAETEDNGLDTEGDSENDGLDAGDGTDAPPDDGSDNGLDTGDDAGDDGLDATDDSMDDGTGDDTAPPADDSGGTAGSTQNTLENQLKYSLFKNIKNLYLAIQRYQDRLESISSSSHGYNMSIKVASSKLSDLEEYIFEYMIIKFKDSTYIESMDFYQKCVTTVIEIFHLLGNNKENIDSKDKTIN